jgi:cytochrome c oxidase subunit 4
MSSETTHLQETEHKHPNYMAVFGALVVLTGIEVAIAQVNMPRTAMVLLLLALALVKAGLVAQYFMHLKYDSKFLSLIAYSPLIVASILMAVLAAEWAFQPHWLF